MHHPSPTRLPRRPRALLNADCTHVLELHGLRDGKKIQVTFWKAVEIREVIGHLDVADEGLPDGQPTSLNQRENSPVVAREVKAMPWKTSKAERTSALWISYVSRRICLVDASWTHSRWLDLGRFEPRTGYGIGKKKVSGGGTKNSAAHDGGQVTGP